MSSIDRPLSGDTLRITLAEEDARTRDPLEGGMLLSLPEGVPHNISSAEGASFLLTVAWPTSAR